MMMISSTSSPSILILAFLTVMGSNPTQAGTPWINEFHYDNSGTDTDEFIEVAKEGDIADGECQILLYNGATKLLYDTDSVGSATAETTTGVAYSVENYPSNGIQNGAPDGIALVCDGTVIEFISYEGSFTAIGGPADGMTSTNIGVSQSNPNSSGDSLQLEGSSCAGSDFTWSKGPRTKGAMNIGQTTTCGDDFGPAWINEFHYDNTGADTGEFIEIAREGGIASNTYQVVLYNGNSNSLAAYATKNVPEASPDSTGVAFSVISHSGIQNGDPDAIALVKGSTVIQFLSYEGVFTAIDGPAIGMTSTDIGKSESSGTPVGFSLQLQGMGCSYAAFSWADPAQETSGSPNTGQQIKCGGGGVDGDPHFETFKGMRYDYMGECDLVLVEAPNFQFGLSLLVAVRTTIRYDYSYVESAVIKIGNETLEVASFGEYFLNGVNGGDLKSTEKSLGPYPVHYEQVNKKRHTFTIDLGNDETIVVSSFKDLVNVHLDNADRTRFHDSKGMVGAYKTGEMIARDGSSMANAEPNAYAAEWQIRPEEYGMLFQANRAPQYPQACILPDDRVGSKTGRRLGQNAITKADAEEACSAVVVSKKADCVHDVMATGDLEVADGLFVAHNKPV